MIKAISFGLAVALAPAGAVAHTLDEYLQASRLSLTRTDVRVDIDLTAGVQIAAPIIQAIDRDQDGLISPAEAAAYGASVLSGAVVELDGERVALALARIEVPPVGAMWDGVGTIRLAAVGAHRARLGPRAVLSFQNEHAPDASVYSVNALVPADRALSVVRQERDVRQRSVKVFYDVRPTPVFQTGWVFVAGLTCLACVVVRRRARHS